MPKKGFFLTSINVDVDIDSSVLEENGYHHEEDCAKQDAERQSEFDELEQNRKELSDWHHNNHGYNLWASCREQPCKLLTSNFRRPLW